MDKDTTRPSPIPSDATPMLFCIAVAIVLVAAALKGWGVLDMAA